MNVKIITRAALLLALTLVFQSLRFFIPVTPFFSTFIIGSLVNTCLFIAVETVGWLPAVMIGVMAPVTAYFQQLLPVPVLIAPVAAGNIILVCMYRAFITKRYLAVASAALAKAFVLYYSFLFILPLIRLPAKISEALLFVMSWPQFVTASAGGMLAALLLRRLK